MLDRGAFSESAFFKRFQKAAKPVGVRGGPGQFRHTWATRAVEAGMSKESVAAYLNHKSKSTTDRFYSTLALVPRPSK